MNLKYLEVEDNYYDVICKLCIKYIIIHEVSFTFSDLLSEYSQWLPQSKHTDLKDSWPPAT